MESLQSMPDRKASYHLLADWTFQGDGELQTLRSLVRRQRLPSWIPESVGGAYPNFPPVADRSLPIATNFFLLAKLAQETDSTEDLLNRLKQARTNERSGADTATAIFRGAMELPIEPKLLESIENQLEMIQPDENKPATAAPLAELQLASILADDPDHREFAKNVTQQFVDHTHRQSRGYLMPWVSRYQHSKGWADTSGLKSGDLLSHWIRSTMASAKEFSEGKTAPIWVTDGERQIDHICGFSQDYLWLRYPLEGNFRFELDSKDGNWGESTLVVDGLRLGAIGSSNAAYLKTQSGGDWLMYYSKAIKKNEWNHFSVTLDDKFLSYRINDTLVYQEERSESTPWIGLHSEGNKKTTVRDIKITGTPIIPREVKMIPEGNLRGWSGQYFGVKLPTADVNLKQREKEANPPRRYRSSPKVTQINSLAWTLRDGELISGEMEKRGFNGQSCLRYERPLGDGESIQYEFFYQPEKMEVHPSIGRVAYLLRPDGCHLHWMNAGSTSWKIPPDYEVPLAEADPIPCPLKPGRWNQVQLQRNEKNLQISLNGETVFDQEPQSRLGDMVFGLYHNGTKTSARIRNMTFQGDWPENLPENLLKTAETGD
jgi:hypothetical protein